MSVNHDFLRSFESSVTAIIQARMGSTRLPGKILKQLAGRPVLFHVVNRLGYSRLIKKIMVATTTNPEDDVVEEFCSDNDILCFRGSDTDVLDRYYQAAKSAGADPIVRITADCPVIDPFVVDEVIEQYLDGKYDVFSLGGEFPDGLDCTVFSFHALEESWKNARLPSEREHVCPYMEKHVEKFRTGSFMRFHGLANHRWTLDEEQDLKFLEAIYDRLYSEDEIFLTADILDLLADEPELMRINAGITRNGGYLKSLEEDKRFLQVQR